MFKIDVLDGHLPNSEGHHYYLFNDTMRAKCVHNDQKSSAFPWRKRQAIFAVSAIIILLFIVVYYNNQVYHSDENSTEKFPNTDYGPDLFPIFPMGTKEESNEIRIAMRQFSTSTIDSSFLLNFTDGSYQIRASTGLPKLRSTEELKQLLIGRLDIDGILDKTILYPIEWRDRPFDFGQFSNSTVVVLNNFDLTDDSFMDDDYVDYHEMLGIRVQIISLCDNKITDKIIPKLITMLKGSRDSLRIINLKNTLITEEGLQLIKNEYPEAILNPDFSEIEYYIFEPFVAETFLSFRGAICDNDLKQLQGLPFTTIFLENTAITSGSLPLFATMVKLKSLNLRGTQICDTNIEWLSKMPHLKDLNLMGTNVTEKGIELLKDSTSLQYLTLDPLSVSNAKIGDGAFSSYPASHPLKSLYLCSRDITDNTLKDLAKLDNLEAISINCASKITNNGLLSLKTAKSLKSAVFYDTSINNSGKIKFQRFRPDVSVCL